MDAPSTSDTASNSFYSQISIVGSHSWPGEIYLRFETGAGPTVMVAVTGADLDQLTRLLHAKEEDK